MTGLPWEHGYRGLAVLLIAACCLVDATRGDPPKQGTVHELSGVVVSKEDGKPIEAATVAMADAEEGWIYFLYNGRLEAYGPEKTLLLFIPRRNGKTACQAVTDAEGRFTLRQFSSMKRPYHIAVLKRDVGTAIRLDVVPGEVGDDGLRIEVEKPAYVTTAATGRPTEDGFRYLSVELEGEATREADADTPPKTPQIYFQSTSYAVADEDESPKLGPFPPGLMYALHEYEYRRDWPFTATVFKRRVRLAAGETVNVTRGREGATLKGQVTGLDGKPLQYVNVMLATQGPEGVVVGAMTDKDGRYELTGIQAGKATLELLRHAIRTAPG